jgi:hypothetical protein
MRKTAFGIRGLSRDGWFSHDGRCRVVQARTRTIFTCGKLTVSSYRKGSTLSQKQVMEIFELKNIGQQQKRFGAAIARSYGITPKAVRDI